MPDTLLGHRRDWEKRYAVVGLDRVTSIAADQALGAFAPGVFCMIVDAFIVFGGDLADDGATTDTLSFALYDRKAAGTGVVSSAVGVCVINTGRITSSDAAFVTNEVNTGDLVTLSGGSPGTNAGIYRVVSVDSNTQITVDFVFTVASTSEDIAITGLVGTAVTNASGLADDVKHTFTASGYFLEKDSVLVVELDWTVAATPGDVPIVGATLMVEYIPFPSA